jgi:hypothetical protein
MVVYLVFENVGLMGTSFLIKTFSTKEKAIKFASNKAKRQKNKPQYDDYGLCDGIEYVVTRVKVY